jgi:hypothetical protein
MTETYSNSELSKYRTCIRAWSYNYSELIVAHGDREPLWFGSLVHAGLELFWSDDDTITEQDLHDELEAWATKNPTDLHNYDILMIQAHAMIRAYWAKWGASRLDYTERQAEGVFVLDIGIEGIKYTGKIDAVGRNKEGILCLIEHKTTGMEIHDPASFYWQRLALDNQITGYQTAMMEQYGEPLQIIYDVLRKPVSKKPKMKKQVRIKKDETVDEFATRKAENTESIEEYEKRINAEYVLALDSYIVRRNISRTDEQRQVWFDEMVDTIKQIETKKKDFVPVYPRNDSSCYKYGGTCEYFGVCCGMMKTDDPSFRAKSAKHEELIEEIK